MRVARTLFISDLHLTGTHPESADRFFRFLEREAADACELYVLGDLFEYWVGDDELLTPQHDPLPGRVGSAFAVLRDRGIVVRIMHGNRDFFIGEGFCRASGAQIINDPAVMDVGGTPTLLMHGDTLCTDDVDYQAWRQTCRAPEWQREFLAKPLGERRRIADGLRETSRDMARTKPTEIMDVTPRGVRDAFRTHGVARLIHGHTHRPARHQLEVDGISCERWVLPDWYGTGGYIEVADGNLKLVLF